MTTKNSGDLRVRDLKVLSLILRERNLTRAAELLDTTQPSISKVLAKLREHFADPLFVRDGHVLRPTPRASEMAEPIRSLLATRGKGPSSGYTPCPSIRGILNRSSRPARPIWL